MPNLSADAELADVLHELMQREPIFHRPEFGTSRADFEGTMAEGFCEVGASGRRYSRAEALDILEKRFAAPHADVWETSDFHCRKLASGVYLLTYNLVQNKERHTRRMTIWQRSAEGWQIVYHQGTIMQDAQEHP
jgi:hypothetical protein